ncbi:MAG: multidrug resistance protein [Bellilinea sp.]|nr:MAG: multidrug resistance protein [Bellilinea sp.]
MNALFLWVVFLYWTALYLYIPTLPLYLQTKTSDLALIGTALSMYGLWQLIVRLPLGILADWAGRRKPFAVVWLLLVAAGALTLGHAPTIETAIIGRALVGISAGTWVPLVVLFSNRFSAGEVVRATGILAMTATTGRIIATAANGWLNQLGGYPLAFNLAAASALTGAALLLFLPETPTPPRKPSLTALRQLASRREVMLPSLLQALTHTADFAATFTFIPILARQKGASDVVISGLLSLNLLIGLAGNSLATVLAQRFGQQRMVALSFALLGGGLLGAAWAPSLIFVFVFQFCIGLGFGIGYPLLMGLSINRVDTAERTTAMGLHQSVYSLGMFLGPWLSGVLAAALNIPLMFLVIGLLILTTGIAGAAILDHRR